MYAELGVRNGQASFRLSVPSIDSSSGHWQVAAEHPAGRRYQSIAGAGAQQQWCRRARHGACSSALSSKRLALCLQLTYEAETDLLSVFLAYISYNICKWLPVDMMCVSGCVIQEALLVRQCKERRIAFSEGSAHKLSESATCNHDGDACSAPALPMANYCLQRILSHCRF